MLYEYKQFQLKTQKFLNDASANPTSLTHSYVLYSSSARASKYIVLEHSEHKVRASRSRAQILLKDYEKPLGGWALSSLPNLNRRALWNSHELTDYHLQHPALPARSPDSKALQPSICTTDFEIRLRYSTANENLAQLPLLIKSLRRWSKPGRFGSMRVDQSQLLTSHLTIRRLCAARRLAIRSRLCFVSNLFVRSLDY